MSSSWVTLLLRLSGVGTCQICVLPGLAYMCGSLAFRLLTACGISTGLMLL